MPKTHFIICKTASQSSTGYSGALEIERGANGDVIVRVHGSESLRAVVRLDACQVEDLRAVLASLAEGTGET